MVTMERGSEFSCLELTFLAKLRFRMVNDLGGKIKVMELMSHESGDVKYQALLTVSSNVHVWQG